MLVINGITYETNGFSRWSARTILDRCRSAMRLNGIPRDDIATEYGLIQQKKSLLSRRQREMVVKIFEKYFRQFELIKEENK